MHEDEDFFDMGDSFPEPDEDSLGIELSLEGLASEAFDFMEGLSEDAQKALSALGLEQHGLSILITDDSHIHRLNLSWRDEDKPTDILSFPAIERDPEDVLAPFDRYLGDLALSLETIERDAALLSWPKEDLAAFLLVHGILHLLGHDHGEPEEAQRMKAEEDRIFLALRPKLKRPPTPY